MGKPALCVRRADVVIDFTSLAVQQTPSNFCDLETVLADRDQCETDPTLLQIIPYIVLRNDGGKIFVYERGSASGEQRLAAKLSVGLGGHVDVAPPAPGASAFSGLLLSEAERELREEVGLDVELSGLSSAVLYTGATGLPVDQVHLGLVIEHNVLQGQQLKLEEGHVTNGRWVTLSELNVPETFERLEFWSQAVVRQFSTALSCQIGESIDHFCALMYGVQLESSTGVTSAAMQEVSATLSGISANLKLGHAKANVFDAEQLGNDIRTLVGSLDHVSMLTGTA
jgi:predicted NUDIX family phosphoesterase